MSYDNTNSFVLFKNDRKEKETQPDYTGKVTLEDGTEKRLAAWIKDGKNGKFMSGKISDYQNNSAGGNQGEPSGGGFDQDIPFAQFEKGSGV